MQKVIVITSSGSLGVNKMKFLETEYPTLNEALNDGFKITQILPIIKPSTTDSSYETIFVLEKF